MKKLIQKSRDYLWEVCMMQRIGVEDSLTDVKEQLQGMGFEVVSLRQEEDAHGCDCCVISGIDNNVMGVQNIVTEGSVINADGMTADEVCQEVQEKMNLLH